MPQHRSVPRPVSHRAFPETSANPILAPNRSRTTEITASVRITQIWQALGGGQLRHRRGQAFWRRGDGFNVALSDEKGAWYDHAAGEGGGILELIQRVHACDRSSAFCWLADYAGIPLDDRKQSPGERREYARRQAELIRELPEAQLWRRAAVLLSEELLISLKAALFDPTAEAINPGEIQFIQQTLCRLRSLTGPALIDKYHSWKAANPSLTGGMLAAARDRDQADQRALEGNARNSVESRDSRVTHSTTPFSV